MRQLTTMVAFGLIASSAVAEEIRRPTFEITSTESFEASDIAAYEGSHDAVYAHIDAHLDDHLANLQRWVRQRSISAQDDGIREMAEMVRGDLEALGFVEAEIVPTGGHPGVWGYYNAGADRTLVVYMMYDVQPVDPEDWRTPPFAGNLVDTELGEVLMARGAMNQKGPERALLNAIASILAVDGTLPVNLMITAEGEEEIGSVHYPEIVDAYEERLKAADGSFFPLFSQSAVGSFTLNLGVKGIIYFELEAVGGPHGGPKDAEIHGSFKAIVDAPALRLVQAISSLTSEDGNTILVPGYYDDVRPPTAEEQRLLNGMLDSWSDETLKKAMGVDEWIDNKVGIDALLDYLYLPTLNIDGIWSGYTKEGAKTILPHKATAKLDSRLPPSIDPHEAMEKIRDHLVAQGFDDIIVREMEAYPAAQSSIEENWVKTAISVINKHTESLSVHPRLAGSAPFYEFTDRLALPLVFGGLGHGSGAHAPNEYMVIHPSEGSGIAGLAAIEKFYVDLLYAFAESAD